MRQLHFLSLSIALAALQLPSRAQVLTRVNTTAAGAQTAGSAAYWDRPIALSRDGRIVAFTSTTAVIPGQFGVFLKDRLTGGVTCASITTTGSAGLAANARDVSLSSDGSVVTYSCDAPNLLATPDTNGRFDIFVHDVTLGVTTRASVSSTGVEANGNCTYPAISGDGRFIAFQSTATNLDPADTDTQADVFLHDRTTGSTTLVSRTPTGAAAHGAFPKLSRDGRFVAFESSSTALDPLHPGPVPAVFVLDRTSGSIERASYDINGAPAFGRFYDTNAEYSHECGGISADGRFVTYFHLTAGWFGILRRDRLTGAVAKTWLGNAGDIEGGEISDDGRFVLFNTHESVVPGDLNWEGDVHVHDFELGTTRRVSLELPGTGYSYWPETAAAAISGDGTVIGFASWVDNLVPNDTNNALDYFVHDWRDVPPQAYCSSAPSLNGCLPTLSTLGRPDGSAGSGFVVTAGQSDGQRSGLFVYGIAGAFAAPWGAGTLCVAAPRQRTFVLSSGGTAGQCDGALSFDWNTYVATHPGALGTPFDALTPVFLQAWARDPGAPGQCVLSNAIEFHSCP